MGLWADWQASRARKQRVEVYLNHLVREAEAPTLAWLTAVCGSADVAARELGFARRAIGLIVAERDALDDQTAADVAHHLAPVVAAESRRHAETGRLWAERWRSYTAALAVRGSQTTPAARLAKVLLEGAGMPAPTAEVLAVGTDFVQETRAALNEQLRTAFGAASLPEDVRPSALRS
ncbi:hypothetical protein GEMMAAP_10300 [Gemmatimonas phototrophica]|uniref:Uncharacterized protein n=2 Tax=Gemmatimonas phototrophica TaxID=1379270 RepID=A0A143BJ79_9BACT|nr:hypothetical protein GEMMAAP_10300 [Gemmatimonas phototrophica]